MPHSTRTAAAVNTSPTANDMSVMPRDIAVARPTRVDRRWEPMSRPEERVARSAATPKTMSRPLTAVSAMPFAFKIALM